MFFKQSVLAVLAVLTACSWAMDARMQFHAVTAYQRWFPESSSVLFQTATYDHGLIAYLRQHVNTMSIVEVAASENYRHFVVPLNQKGLCKRFGMPYCNAKHYFAAFRGPWNANVATFDGVAAINGVNQRELVRKLRNEIESFTPAQYGVTLQVP